MRSCSSAWSERLTCKLRQEISRSWVRIPPWPPYSMLGVQPIRELCRRLALSNSLRRARSFVVEPSYIQHLKGDGASFEHLKAGSRVSAFLGILNGPFFQKLSSCKTNAQTQVHHVGVPQAMWPSCKSLLLMRAGHHCVSDNAFFPWQASMSRTASYGDRRSIPCSGHCSCDGVKTHT